MGKETLAFCRLCCTAALQNSRWLTSDPRPSDLLQVITTAALDSVTDGDGASNGSVSFVLDAGDASAANPALARSQTVRYRPIATTAGALLAQLPATGPGWRSSPGRAWCRSRRPATSPSRRAERRKARSQLGESHSQHLQPRIADLAARRSRYT
jgi:hypothetical protein